MKPWIKCVFVSGLALLPMTGWSADSYWTGGNNSFNSPTAWIGGVPGGNDNANWTAAVDQANITFSADVLNANAYFNRTGGRFSSFSMGAQTWTVTNQFIIGQNPGTADAAVIGSGTLAVTNGAGTAKVQANSGNSFLIAGGTVIADRFIMTNVPPSGQEFSFYTGTLNTLHGAELKSTGQILYFGRGAGTSTWNMLGGSNYISATTFNIGWSPNAHAVLNVSGAGTYLAITNNISMANDGNGSALFKASDGARVEVTGNIAAGAYAPATIMATGSNTFFSTGGETRLGAFAGGNPGYLIVSNGALYRVGGHLRVGYGTFDTGQATVTGNGSELRVLGTTYVGANGVSNGKGGILVTDQATLDVVSINTGTLNSGTVSNRGGIYQFSTANPQLFSNSPDSMLITNGTISFRSITDASVVQVGTRLTNITFQGVNTFRLNGASNTTTGVSQTYTFNATGVASNYAHLVMANGQTAYGQGNITIGNNGSMLLTNTRATVTGLFTNNGLFTSLNSVGTFNSAVVNNGAWVTDPTTNVFLSNYTVGNAGSISMGAGDVFIFKSNFVNTSTQNMTYDTTDGKFVFDGAARTQSFYTAGHDFGPGPTVVAGTQTNTLFGAIPDDNFALGIFEIANFSTVRVSDAFSLLGPGTNDNLRAALYVDQLFMGANSLLIVDTNVSVYFVSSNNWSSANFVLLGDAELHQVIPEPSLLFLLGVGGVVLWRARRSKAQWQID